MGPGDLDAHSIRVSGRDSTSADLFSKKYSRARNLTFFFGTASDSIGVAEHLLIKTMAYKHTVWAVFDPDDSTGFMYSVGMGTELFVLDVPREHADGVCRTMNFLSTRRFKANENVKSEELGFRLEKPTGARRAKLKKTHLKMMEPDAQVLELVPFLGWPAVTTPIAGLHCKCCQCVECSA